MDIRTEKQKERTAYAEDLAKAYKTLKKENPGAKPSRILKAMAASGAYRYKSALGIKKAIERTTTTL